MLRRGAGGTSQVAGTARDQGPGRRLRRALRTPGSVPRRRCPGRTVMSTAIDTEALREQVASRLLAARARTSGLTDCVDEDDLARQHSPLMSPLVWDLAHIANQEELWLLRGVGGREPMHPEIDPLYDAFEHPRAERPTLPLLRPAETGAYAREGRGPVLDLVERASFTGGRLVTGGFAFGMIAQHAKQHGETRSEEGRVGE